jgi:hypothetical protein
MGVPDLLADTPLRVAGITSDAIGTCMTSRQQGGIHVSIMSLSSGPLMLPIHRERQNHRYNRGYEEAMGVQEKRHPRMVVWLV